MKKTNFKLIFLGLFGSLLMTQSCLKEEDLVDDLTSLDTSTENEYIPKGKLLKNPYEIHTFRTSFQTVVDSLKGGAIKTGKGFTAKSDLDSTAIEPNYLYLRFNPLDSVQEHTLLSNSDIIFLDYPFEYEEPEDYRATLNLENLEILSYWCSVPIDQELPQVSYNVLQEMYLPEADPEYNDDAKNSDTGKTLRGNINDKIDLINHVIEQAYIATGNDDLLPEKQEGKIKGETCETCFLGINLRDKWTPEGKIEIWDDIIGLTTTTRQECEEYQDTDYSPCYTGDMANCPKIVTKTRCETVTSDSPGSYIPLEGANVLARDTWTIASAITDSNGNFRMNTIRAKARFLIQWDRQDFSIRDKTGFFQAEDTGPKLYDQDWNHKIKGGREEYRGHIFQAALDYYYHDIGELTYRPPTNNFFRTQIKIVAREVNGSSSANLELGFDTLGLFGHIRIKKWREGSEAVYGTTIHELAHAVHYRMDPIAWNTLVTQGYILNLFSDNPGVPGTSARRLMESWATGIEVYLNKLRYSRYGVQNYRYKENDYQNQVINAGRGRFYSPTFYDMTEDFNQRDVFNSQQVADDNVDNISWPLMELSIIGNIRWEGCKESLKSLNPTQANEIEALFESFPKE